mmetsp:Transcript_13177/g.27912  ORF Transcript_13177/g.27912 Transcript_13177/m.27912 type:complete len:295 (+) Transcript_13177:2820-3704(+)
MFLRRGGAVVTSRSRSFVRRRRCRLFLFWRGRNGWGLGQCFRFDQGKPLENSVSPLLDTLLISSEVTIPCVILLLLITSQELLNTNLHLLQPFLVMLSHLSTLIFEQFLRPFSKFIFLVFEVHLLSLMFDLQLLLNSLPLSTSLFPRQSLLLYPLLHHSTGLVKVLALFHGNELKALGYLIFVTLYLPTITREQIVLLFLLFDSCLLSDCLHLGTDLAIMFLHPNSYHGIELDPFISLFGIKASHFRFPPFLGLGCCKLGVDRILLLVRFGIEIKRIFKFFGIAACGVVALLSL